MPIRPKYSISQRAPGSWVVRCVRQFSDESQDIPADEAAWATTRQRMADLFWWHRNFGLARRTPHPMGKDLDALEAADNAGHAARYIKAGMAIPGCYLPVAQ